MSIFDRNPYRLLGVYSNISESELLKQKTRLVRFLSVGKTEAAPTDFPLLGNVERTVESVEEAAKAIEQPQEKLLHSLNWFINHTPADAVAFEHLREGNPDKAKEIWNLAIDGKDITSRNFSSCLNLSTLMVAEAFSTTAVDVQRLKSGFELKGRLIESEGIGFVADIIVDGSLDGDSSSLSGSLEEEASTRLADLFYDNAKGFISSGFSARDLISAIGEASAAMATHLIGRLSERPIAAIEEQIQKAVERVREDKHDAARAGFDLYNAALPLLKEVQGAIGESELSADTVRNNLANQLLNCSIAYFNEFHSSGDVDPGPDAKKLIDLAQSLQPTGEVAARITENLPAIIAYLEDNKYRASTLPYLTLIRLAISDVRTDSGGGRNCSAIVKTGRKVAKVIESAKKDSKKLQAEEIAFLCEQGFEPLFGMTVDSINFRQEVLGAIFKGLKAAWVTDAERSHARSAVQEMLSEINHARNLIRTALSCGASGDFKKRLKDNLTTLSKMSSDMSRSTGVSAPMDIGAVTGGRDLAFLGIPFWLWAIGSVALVIILCNMSGSSPSNQSLSNSNAKSTPVDADMRRFGPGIICRDKIGEDCDSKVTKNKVKCEPKEDCVTKNKYASRSGLGTLSISVFDLDLYEVTRKQFSEYAKKKGLTFKVPSGQDDNQPVVGVTFDEARGYCTDKGKRLPNEDEWEFAAREGDKWKWVPVGGTLRGKGSSVSQYARELNFSDSIIGNVSEWTDKAGTNSRFIMNGEKPVRGASFADKGPHDAFRRQVVSEQTRNSKIGFRCAK